MKYVIYTRVSKENERSETDAEGNIIVDSKGKRQSQELGLQKQLDACLSICNGKPYVHFEDKDNSAVPRFKKRKIFLQALAACAKGDVLLVYSSDRLARSKDVAVIKYLLSEKKARLEYANGTLVDSDDAKDIVMEHFEGLFAIIEAKNISDRTKKALGILKKRGRVYGNPPYGWKAEGKMLVQCPVEQKYLACMAHLDEAGLGSRDIRDELNTRGWFNRKGKPWGHRSIWQILKREAAKLQDQLQSVG